MTRVLVVGDSLAGKTKMLQLATAGHIPYNVFRSTQIEEYEPISGATFYVVPGGITDANLQQLCVGVDGVVVVYASTSSICAAKRWLTRISRLAEGVHRVPVLICCSGYDRDSMPPLPDARLSNLLRRYPFSEHTYLVNTSLCGTRDCINRIVCRIRRESPSPLAIVRQLTESR